MIIFQSVETTVISFVKCGRKNISLNYITIGTGIRLARLSETSHHQTQWNLHLNWPLITNLEWHLNHDTGIFIFEMIIVKRLQNYALTTVHMHLETGLWVDAASIMYYVWRSENIEIQTLHQHQQQFSGNI